MGRKMDKIQKLTINCIVLISFSSAIFTDELKDIIKSKGGVPSSSVSSNTNYLLYGEKAGSKYKKALELGVELVDETKIKDFLKI